MINLEDDSNSVCVPTQIEYNLMMTTSVLLRLPFLWLILTGNEELVVFPMS